MTREHAADVLTILRVVTAEQLEERRDEREQRFSNGLDELIDIANDQLTVEELVEQLAAYDLAIAALAGGS